MLLFLFCGHLSKQDETRSSGGFPPCLMRLICLNRAVFFGWVLGCSSHEHKQPHQWFHQRKESRERLGDILEREPQPERPYAPGTFTVSSWISSVCWQWHSEPLLINWNAPPGLDQRGLHIAARGGAYTFRTQQAGAHNWKPSGAFISQRVRAQRSEETQHCCRSDVRSVHGITLRKLPLAFDRCWKPACGLFLFSQRFTSSHIFRSAATFPRLCHVSTRHLFSITTQLGIQSRSHAAAIVELQIEWNQNVSQNYSDWGSVSRSVPQHCRNYLRIARLVAGFVRSDTIDLGGGSIRIWRSFFLSDDDCAREAVGLLLRAAQPVNRWGRHTVARPAESTQTPGLHFSVLLQDKCSALWIATICPAVIRADSLCEYINAWWWHCPLV